MIRSMTGYGKGQGNADGITLTVELKSVNHRYMDITVKSPRSLLPFEAEIKKKVGERLRRGKVDVFINQEFATAGGTVPVLNRPLAEAYVRLFDEMRSDFPVEGSIPLALLAAQKDVILVTEGSVPEELIRGCLDEGLLRALDAMEKMRLAEGESTRIDMEERLSVVEGFLVGVEERAPQVPIEWQAKLKDRLARLQTDVEFDPQRLAQELALFADRCDISEELVRFKSHLQQFRGLFAVADPVGRQMDFLAQELNREVNTMGSKSNDAELTRQVVAIKAELEKVREQIQNVE